MPPGSSGLAALLRQIDGHGAAFATRFAATFVTVSLAWTLLAPVYAAVLAQAATLLSPVLALEQSALYELDDGRIVAARRTVVGHRRATVRQGLWDARLTWSLPLLVAALLSVPDWTPSRRACAVVYAVAGMSALHTSHVLVNVVFTQMRTPGGDATQWPPVARVLVPTYSYFCDVIGNGLTAFVLFCLLVERLWLPTHERIEVGRNEPCPCGSGRKAKRCCGMTA